MLLTLGYILLALVSLFLSAAFFPVTAPWIAPGRFEGWDPMLRYVAALVFAVLAVRFVYLIIRRFIRREVWPDCFHKWDGCVCVKCGEKRDRGHDWDGCVCRRCGAEKLTYEKGHEWDGCTCKKCRKTRDEAHEWDGCVCVKCGRERDAAHDWVGCVCVKCGKTRDEEHDWDGCACKKCGKTRHDVGADCVCRVCGAECHEEGTEHFWFGNDNEMEVRKCTHCGKHL